MKFVDYVLLEQVRALEEQRSPDLPLVAPSEFSPDRQQSFAEALHLRAKGLLAEHEWGAITAAPAQWYRRLTIFVLVLFALLGVIAVLNALSGEANSRVLNIYGLLLVLLGFNLISLILWLLGCLAKWGGLISGSLGSLPIGMENLLRRFQQKQSRTAYSAWQDSHFSGKVGTWRLSLVSHSIWLSYLCAGLLSLLVLFSIRQYDFIWGSTLLSGGMFVDLTRGLGTPLQLLGISMPDPAQVLASQSGSITERSLSNTDIRRQWAWFLLGAVAVYGLLPRLLAALVSWWVLKRAESRYRPDFYLPYYVELKHRSQAEVSKAEVVDADSFPRDTIDADGQLLPPLTANVHELPAGTYYAGFELDDNLLHSLSVNIVDRESYAASLQAIAAANQAVAIIVDLEAVPDRGTRRKLVELFGKAKEAYLILLDNTNNSANPVSSVGDATERQRVADWYQLAGDAAVPVEHVQIVSPANLATIMVNR